jgi:hypothetical protein
LYFILTAKKDIKDATAKQSPSLFSSSERKPGDQYFRPLFCSQNFGEFWRRT